MTRDEVRSIIAEEIGWKLITPKRYTPNQYADAVLAALAANGVVLAEIATYTSDIDMKPIRERELALVRVVPND